MNNPNTELEVESPTSLRDPSAPREEWNDEISLFDFGSTLLEQRLLIFRVTLLVAILVIMPSLFMGSTYTSDALVVTTEGGRGDARLQGLAGQFGINLGGGGSSNPTAAPNFLVQLASSRVILERMLSDTLVTEEALGGIVLLDFLAPQKDAEIEGLDSPLEMAKRRQEAIKELRDHVKLKVERDLNALRISVKTESATISNHLAKRILEELGRFNLELAQARAGEERRFVQARMVKQQETLRAAEARLGTFLDANREFRSSPELTFEHDRLQREVALQQQVLLQLAQSNEDARIREVRDTPVITVIEPPVLAIERDPKGRVRRALLGLIAGGMFGVFIAYVVGFTRKQLNTDDPEAKRFMALFSEAFSMRRAPKAKG